MWTLYFSLFNSICIEDGTLNEAFLMAFLTVFVVYKPITQIVTQITNFALHLYALNEIFSADAGPY